MIDNQDTIGDSGDFMADVRRANAERRMGMETAIEETAATGFVPGRVMPEPAMPAAPKFAGFTDEDAQLARRMAEDKKLAFMSTMMGAVDVNPDKAAEAIRFGNEVGVGPDIALNDFDSVQHAAKMKRIEQMNLMRRFPILARQLQDQTFANIAHDDLDNLAATEDMFSVIRGIPERIKGIPQGIAEGFKRGVATYELADLYERQRQSGGNLEVYQRAAIQSINDEMAQLGKESGFWESASNVVTLNLAQAPEVIEMAMMTMVASGLAGGVAGAGGGVAVSGGVLAPVTAVTGLAGGLAVGLPAGLAAGAYESSRRLETALLYGEARSAGLDHEASNAAALAGGAISGLLEVAGVAVAGKAYSLALKNVIREGVKDAIKDRTRAQVFRTVGKTYLIGGAGEVGTEITQDIVNRASLEIAKAVRDQPTMFDNPGELRKFGGQLVDTALETAMAMTLLGIPGAAVQFHTGSRRAAEAQRNAKFFDALAKNAAETKVAPRDGDKYRAYIGNLVNGTKFETMYVDAGEMRTVLQQQGLTLDDADSVFPGIKAQLEEIVGRTGDVTIPTAVYAERGARTDLGQAILPHVRPAPNAMSPLEAQQFAAERETLVREARSVLQEKERIDTAFVQEAQELEDVIRSEIRAARPDFDPAVARGWAKMSRDFYVVLAADLNTTPKALFEQRKLQRMQVRGVEGAAVGGGPLEQADQFDQAGQRRTDTPEFKAWSNNAPVVSKEESEAHQFSTGTPVVVEALHGSTKRGLRRFDVGRAVEVPGAIFFTSNENAAEQYTYERAYGEIISEQPTGDVIRAYVAFANPMVYQPKGKVVDAIEMGRAIEQAKSAGHDGLIIKNIDDSIGMTGDMGDVYVTWNPTSIKSVNNRGTWSRTTANIMEQAATMDAEYLAAVERGDMATAQRMVDEAAKAAGYTIPVYHFTDETFTAFDVQRGEAGPGIWLTSSPEGWFGENRLNLYLNPGKIENVKSQWDKTWREGELSIEGILEGDLETMSSRNIETLRNAGDYDSTFYVATRPEQVKSADPVTYDEAGNVVPLSRRFDITSPRIFEQAAMPSQAGADAPGVAVANENRLGFWPALRVRIQPDAALPEKPLILTGTTNKNATKQLANLDDILGQFPNAAESPEAWAQMLAYAFGTDDVPVPPYAFINDTNGNGSFARLSTLTQGQIADATHGFDNAREFRRAYINNELNVVTTGKLFLWSFLSRGVSPYTQESLFIDAFDGANEWIKKAAAGKFTEADFDDYTAWAKSVAKKGSGQPGAGATHNLNAFGKNFLFKMGAIGEDGKSNLQRLHDMMSDPEQTGRMIRREFAKFGEGVGIDNKVVSFTLLVAGFNDVMVLDRVQVRQLWDDGRFSGTNLYDGVMDAEGQKIAGSSLNALTEGVRGILVYEAIERQLAAKINDLYAKLGRPQDASIGRYHWETWVAYSQQEAAHATLDAILLDAKGDDQAIAKVSGKQGEYGSYEYGAQYNRDTDRTPWFRYTTPLGGTYDFSVPAFRQFLTEIKKVGNGVVPAKFKVTESGNAPWYTRTEVNQQRLEEQAAKWSDRGGGTGEGARLVRKAAADADAIRARSGAGVQPAGRGEVLEQAARGEARGGFDPVTFILTLGKNADLTTFGHEAAHAFFEMYGQIAVQPNAPQRIRDSFDVLLRWGSIAGATPEERIATWNALPFEGRRKLHESFAYNWEIYLFEGKAPSVEMRDLFRKFSAWIRRVYKTIREELTVPQTISAIYRERYGEELLVLTPEVRQVMDRMLASEEQIAYREAVDDMKPMLTGRPDGMSDEAWAEYESNAAAARQDAVDELTRQSMKDMQWLSRAKATILKKIQAKNEAARSEIRDEVTEQVKAMPVYRAMSYLRRGKLVDADGTETETSGTHRLDVDLVRNMYELRERVERLAEPSPEEADIPTMESVEDAMRPNWRKLGTGKYGMLGSDGLAPDMVAEMFGYANGDIMVRELIAAKPMAEMIADETDRVMTERYGIMTSPEAIEIQVQEALHNEARARMVATELKFLRKAVQPIRVLTEAARQAAQDIVDKKVIRELRPAEYTASEARAARQASTAAGRPQDPQTAGKAAYTRTYNEQVAAGVSEEEAVLAASTALGEATARAERALAQWQDKYGGRDPAEIAIRAKQQQLLQNQLAAEALKARDAIDKALAGFRKFFKADAKIAKTREMPLVMAARAILAQRGIGRSDKPAAAYLEQLKEYNPSIHESVSEIVIAAGVGDYRDMTVEDFRTMAEAVEALWVKAKRDRLIQVGDEKVELDAAVDSLVGRLEEIGIPKELPGERQAIQFKDKSARFAMGVRAMARRIESWSDAMDGKGKDRSFTRLIYRIVKDASTAFKVRRNEQIKKMYELVAKLEMPEGKIAAEEINYTFGAGNAGIGKAELLGAMLHIGNQSNYRKLLVGRGWGQIDENGNLDDSRWRAFVSRMIQQNMLTKKDFDFLQAVWDLNEEIKPLLQKAHYDLEGYYFKEIEADQVVTPFGTYRGGYVPAATDKFMVADAAQRAGMEELQADWRYSLPSTGMGMTKARVKGYNRPLALDLRLIVSHTDAALRFAMIQPAIADVLKIVKNRRFSDAMNRVDPEVIQRLILPWLNRAAKQSVSEAGLFRPVDQFWTAARSRTGMSIMFASVRNAAQQVVGLFPAALKVKPTHLKNALVRYMSSPLKTADMVAALSPFMQERLRSQAFDMQDRMNEILLNPSKYQKAQEWSRQHAYFLQTAFQNPVDVITWLGAYNQFLADQSAGMTPERAEREAIAAGDSAVRLTQGSMQPEDIATIEAGTPFFRTFTQFSGYFNAMGNLNATEFVKTMRDMGWRGNKGKLLYIYMLGIMAPAIVSDAIVRSLGGGWDDDDEDGYLDIAMDWFFGSQVRYVTAFVPFGTTGYTLVTTAFDNKPYNDRMTTSPAVTAIEASTVGVGKAIVNAVDPDKEITGKNVRDVLTLVSLATGLPVSAAGRPIGYLVDVERGKIEPEGPVDLVRGLLTGTVTPESKR